jgi:hypothetical protein
MDKAVAGMTHRAFPDGGRAAQFRREMLGGADQSLPCAAACHQ